MMRQGDDGKEGEEDHDRSTISSVRAIFFPKA